MTESKRALGSNLGRLDATTDEEIARHMAEDDSPEWSAEDFAKAEVWHGNKFLGHGRDFKGGRRVGRPLGSGKKELVSLRLDHAILDHFRAGGPGWQTRLNDALLAGIGQQIEEVRHASFDAGHAAAMQEVREFAATTPPLAGRVLQAAVRAAASPAPAVRVARRQRGTNAGLIVEVMKEMPTDTTVRIADIHKVLKSDKGVTLAFTSIRHALGQLAERHEVIASDDGKTWHYVGSA